MILEGYKRLILYGFRGSAPVPEPESKKKKKTIKERKRKKKKRKRKFKGINGSPKRRNEARVGQKQA